MILRKDRLPFLLQFITHISYSRRLAKTVPLVFKFCTTKTVRLDCSKIHLIKTTSNTKKELHWEGREANQMFK